MADGRQEPYDPYLPAGGAAGTAGGAPQQGNQRTAALQAVSSFLSQSLFFYHLETRPPGFRSPTATPRILRDTK